MSTWPTGDVFTGPQLALGAWTTASQPNSG